MPRSTGRGSPRRRRLAAALALAGSLCALGDAVAQDDAKVYREATRLRAPALRGAPEEQLEIVTFVLGRRVERADEVLREILRDTSKGAESAAEQIVVGTIHDNPERRLLPDVVERLRIENGSALDTRLDEELRRYSDIEMVEQLTALARDTDRPIAYRNAALRTLGRTELDEAVWVLFEFWGGPEEGLHAQASRSFHHLLPQIPDDYEQAVTVMDRIRADGVPLVVVLRDAVRSSRAEIERLRRKVGDTGAERAYIKSLIALLPGAGLDDILSQYLTSPSEEVRAAGARRLGELPYAGDEPGEQRRKAASACLGGLVSEGSERVELALLESATALADAVRGRVEMPWMEAVKTRVQSPDRFSRAVQLEAVKFLGALKDPGQRSLEMLKARFEALEDTDAEFRLALLSSIASISDDHPEAQVRWLVARGRAERNEQVLARILLALGGVKANAEDPDVVAFFRAALADARHSEEVHSNAQLVLGSFWRSEVVAARDALIEVGLAHDRTAVRRASAAELAARYPGIDNAPTIRALQELLVKEQDVDVRKAAARSVVELDLDNAARNLVGAFGDAEVWNVYVSQLVERMDDEVRPDVAVAAADFLVTQGQTIKAQELLKGMVAARPDSLWPGKRERGIVRRRLVEMFLEQQQFAAARPYAKSLADAADSGQGPVHVWRLLWGRTLLGIGEDELPTAQQVLRSLAFDPQLPDAPVGLRARALFQLALCMEERDDPKRANLLFSEVQRALPAVLADSAAAVEREQKKPDSDASRDLAGAREAHAPLERMSRVLDKRIETTATAAAKQKERVYAACRALGTANDVEARAQLRSLEHKAALYILGALGGQRSSEEYDEEWLLGIKRNFQSTTELRQLIEAAAIIKRVEVQQLGQQLDDEMWARAIFTARKQLLDVIAAAWPPRR